MIERQRVDPARIGWHLDGHPYSIEFDDIYFSRSGPVAEAEHVFLGGNELQRRWGALGAADGGRPGSFIIAETGFGTGLNFLVTLRHWRRHAPEGATLEYRAVERHPPAREDLRRILGRWTELDADAHQILDRYPGLPAGAHTIEWRSSRVRLRLWIAELGAALPELVGADLADPANAIHPPSHSIDAWYLDGFAPKRNPEMWTAALYQAMGAHTRSGGTFATYTAARPVRDGLQSAGFRLERVPGLAPKKYMLRGNQPPRSSAT